MGTRLIRIDKNGTKYFESDACPRCDGRGFIRGYEYVEGGVCFKCGGSGFGHQSWKEYTTEYLQILEERRQAKAKRKADKFHANISEHYKNLGLTEDGRCFIVMAKTWERKDELKAAGARFNGGFWFLPHADETWDTVEVDAKPLLLEYPEQERLIWGDHWDLKQVVTGIAKERREKENASKVSEFFGSIGERFETEVTFDKWFQFETTDFRGEDCTMYGYKLSDSEGHHFVWVTGTNPWHLFAENEDGTTKHFAEREWIDQQIGRKLTLKGTVKAHKEREGLKETQLNRCKFKLA